MGSCCSVVFVGGDDGHNRNSPPRRRDGSGSNTDATRCDDDGGSGVHVPATVDDTALREEGGGGRGGPTATTVIGVPSLAGLGGGGGGGDRTRATTKDGNAPLGGAFDSQLVHDDNPSSGGGDLADNSGSALHQSVGEQQANGTATVTMGAATSSLGPSPLSPSPPRPTSSSASGGPLPPIAARVAALRLKREEERATAAAAAAAGHQSSSSATTTSTAAVGISRKKPSSLRIMEADELVVMAGGGGGGGASPSPPTPPKDSGLPTASSPSPKGPGKGKGERRKSKAKLGGGGGGSTATITTAGATPPEDVEGDADADAAEGGAGGILTPSPPPTLGSRGASGHGAPSSSTTMLPAVGMVMTPSRPPTNERRSAHSGVGANDSMAAAAAASPTRFDPHQPRDRSEEAVAVLQGGRETDIYAMDGGDGDGSPMSLKGMKTVPLTGVSIPSLPEGGGGEAAGGKRGSKRGGWMGPNNSTCNSTMAVGPLLAPSSSSLDLTNRNASPTKGTQIAAGNHSANPLVRPQPPSASDAEGDTAANANNNTPSLRGDADRTSAVGLLVTSPTTLASPQPSGLPPLGASPLRTAAAAPHTPPPAVGLTSASDKPQQKPPLPTASTTAAPPLFSIDDDDDHDGGGDPAHGRRKKGNGGGGGIDGGGGEGGGGRGGACTVASIYAVCDEVVQCAAEGDVVGLMDLVSAWGKAVLTARRHCPLTVERLLATNTSAGVVPSPPSPPAEDMGAGGVMVPSSPNPLVSAHAATLPAGSPNKNQHQQLLLRRRQEEEGDDAEGGGACCGRVRRAGIVISIDAASVPRDVFVLTAKEAILQHSTAAEGSSNALPSGSGSGGAARRASLSGDEAVGGRAKRERRGSKQAAALPTDDATPPPSSFAVGGAMGRLTSNALKSLQQQRDLDEGGDGNGGNADDVESIETGSTDSDDTQHTHAMMHRQSSPQLMSSLQRNGSTRQNSSAAAVALTGLRRASSMVAPPPTTHTTTNSLPPTSSTVAPRMLAAAAAAAGLPPTGRSPTPTGGGGATATIAMAASNRPRPGSAARPTSAGGVGGANNAPSPPLPFSFLRPSQTPLGPFHAAARHNHADVMEYLNKYGGGGDHPSHHGSASASRGGINEVLHGRAPLHEAILAGHHKLVYQMLHHHGAAVTYPSAVLVRQSQLADGRAAWAVHTGGGVEGEGGGGGGEACARGEGGFPSITVMMSSCVPLLAHDPHGILPTHATVKDEDEEGVGVGAGAGGEGAAGGSTSAFPLRHLQYIILCEACRAKEEDGGGGDRGSAPPLLGLVPRVRGREGGGGGANAAIHTGAGGVSRSNSRMNTPTNSGLPPPHQQFTNNNNNSIGLSNHGRRSPAFSIGSGGGGGGVDGMLSLSHSHQLAGLLPTSPTTARHQGSAAHPFLLQEGMGVPPTVLVSAAAESGMGDGGGEGFGDEEAMQFMRLFAPEGGRGADHDACRVNDGVTDDDADDPIVPAFCPMCCVEEQPLHTAVSIGDFGMVLVLLETVVTAVCSVLGTKPTAMALGHRGGVASKAIGNAAAMARLVEDKGQSMESPLNRWKAFVSSRRRQSANVVGGGARPASSASSRPTSSPHHHHGGINNNINNNNNNNTNNASTSSATMPSPSQRPMSSSSIGGGGGGGNNNKSLAASNPPFMEVTKALGLDTAALAMLASFVNMRRFSDGFTALHAAAGGGYGDIMDVLIAHNADPIARAVPCVSAVYVGVVGEEGKGGGGIKGAVGRFEVPLEALWSPSSLSLGLDKKSFTAAAAGGVDRPSSALGGGIGEEGGDSSSPNGPSAAATTTTSAVPYRGVGVRPADVAKLCGRSDLVHKLAFVVVNGGGGASTSARIALGLVDGAYSRRPPSAEGLLLAEGRGKGAQSAGAVAALASIAIAAKSSRKVGLLGSVTTAADGLFGLRNGAKIKINRRYHHHHNHHGGGGCTRSSALEVDVTLLTRQLGAVRRFTSAADLDSSPSAPAGGGDNGAHSLLRPPPSAGGDDALPPPTSLADLFERNRRRQATLSAASDSNKPSTPSMGGTAGSSGGGGGFLSPAPRPSQTSSSATMAAGGGGSSFIRSGGGAAAGARGSFLSASGGVGMVSAPLLPPVTPAPATSSVPYAGGAAAGTAPPPIGSIGRVPSPFTGEGVVRQTSSSAAGGHGHGGGGTAHHRHQSLSMSAAGDGAVSPALLPHHQPPPQLASNSTSTTPNVIGSFAALAPLRGGPAPLPLAPR